MVKILSRYCKKKRIFSAAVTFCNSIIYHILVYVVRVTESVYRVLALIMIAQVLLPLAMALLEPGWAALPLVSFLAGLTS
jgi:hypothetical protein